MISRRQAEAARDHAMHAHAGVTAHLNECGKCQRGGVPCKLGSILQRGAMKISREARDALTAYLPAGSQVTYHGRTAAYRDRVWVVVGPSPTRPWSAYVLTAPGTEPFTATLPSLQLTNREAQQREMQARVLDGVSACAAVLAKNGIRLDVTVDRSETGIVRVTWTSSELIRAEARAQSESGTEAGQYIAAALHLLQALRAHTQRREAHEIERDARNARKLAARCGVRV